MNFFDAVKTCFVKYTNFSDRASRSEFWLFTLFTWIVSCMLLFLDPMITGVPFWESFDDPYAPLSMVFTLAIIIPSLSVTARRLHDVNRSGWWMLLFLTIVGIIPLLYWFCQSGKETGYSKPVSKWVTLFIIPLGGVVVCIAVGHSILIESGIVPGTEVISGEKIPDRQLEDLISSDIILPNDHVLYFYSEGLFSVTEGGQLLTQDRIVVYWIDDNDKLLKGQMLYKNIESVELITQGGYFEDSLYQINGDENASYENMTILLSTVNQGDQRFINKLKSFLD